MVIIIVIIIVFINTIEDSVLKTIPNLIETGCPSDWSYSSANAACFFVSTSSANFDNANVACSSMNSHLPA